MGNDTHKDSLGCPDISGRTLSFSADCLAIRRHNPAGSLRTRAIPRLLIVEQRDNALRFGSPLRSNLLGTAARGTVGGQYPRPDE
ncbi:Unknown protein sequence [Pseudomonas coronafaciens pv. oryzae]|nr:Unknown protein sequence [Pseudomonas coronafaciens pv. oryzae]